MNAAFFLTQHQLEHQRKQQLKEQKRQLTLKKKKCEKKLKNLTIKDDVKLRSIMSQLYCTVALQVELLDELEECFYLSKMPLFQEFSEKFIKLNNELLKSPSVAAVVVSLLSLHLIRFHPSSSRFLSLV